MDFFMKVSHRIRGVFLVEPETDPRTVGLMRMWEERSSPHIDIQKSSIETDSWSLPSFLDIELEGDLDYFGISLDADDVRVAKGIEWWHELSFHGTYDADVDIDEVRKNLALEWYYSVSDFDDVDWSIESKVEVYGSSLEEVEERFSSTNLEHSSARAAALDSRRNGAVEQSTSSSDDAYSQLIKIRDETAKILKELDDEVG